MKLKPCPFCGSSDLVTASFEHPDWTDPNEVTAVNCNNCGALGPAALNEGTAHMLWNNLSKPNEELLKETAAMIKYILEDGYCYEGGKELLGKIEAIVGKAIK